MRSLLICCSVLEELEEEEVPVFKITGETIEELSLICRDDYSFEFTKFCPLRCVQLDSGPPLPRVCSPPPGILIVLVVNF
jgi:hypothetical protein